MAEDWFPADDVRLMETVQFIGSVQNKRVLDAGMKHGFALKSINASLKVGFDLEHRYVETSEAELKFLGDVFSIPLKDSSFDIALFTEVIEHIQNPEMALAELARVSDAIIISTPNNSWARKIKHRILRKSDLIAPGHLREYSLGELKEMAHRCGLKVTRVKGTGFFATYRLYPIMNALGRILPSISAGIILEIRRA